LLSRPTPSRPNRAVRLLLGAAALATAAGIAVVPTTAQAATPSPGATGLHEGMLPSSSPDAQSTLGGTTTRMQAESVASLVGIDVSSHQHPGNVAIDWKKVAASGQSFALVKATELYTDSYTGKAVPYTNPWLQQDLAGARAAGLVVGSYAFAHPENDPVRQADAFAAAVGRLPAGSLPLVLDLEVTGGLGAPSLVAWTHAFLDRLQADTGSVPMIYSSPSFWRTALGGSTAFAGYPLWEAHYTSAAQPYAMGGWARYNLWQFTSSAAVPGIVGPVDQSRFNGADRAALARMVQAVGKAAVSARATAPGAAADLGRSTGGILCGLAGGGCLQHFTRNASIYWSPTSGAHVVRGAIRAGWGALGWEWGFGYPTGDEYCGLRGGGCGQHFTGGKLVYFTPAAGAHEISGNVQAVWGRQGWENGALGYPVGNSFCGLTGGGCGQHFQGGSVYWSRATGGHIVTGAIRTKWGATGWEWNLGYPTTDAKCGLVRGGCGQQFSRNASIYWSPTTKAHVVRDAIRKAWVASGWEKGRYGYPVGDATRKGSVLTQRFEGGVISVRA
jgi:GH25 family lysozyme M1 (1,4-beta-N-acetylmuramidase)